MRRLGLLVLLTLVCATLPLPAQILPADPEGHWPMDGDADDASGHGHHGIPSGATLIPDRFGNVDGAYHFDGDDDFIDVGADPELRSPLPVSITAWVRVDDFESNHVFSNNFTQNTYAGVWMSCGILGVSAGYGDGGPPSTSSRRSKSASVPPCVGEWYHAAIVVRGPEDMDIYVNGVDVGGSYSGTGGALAYTTEPATIGRLDSSIFLDPHYFHGAIDELMIYTRELSALEIEELYGPSTPKLFIRGDCNADGTVNIADPVSGLAYLFSGAPTDCLDAHDTNDDGQVDISDPIYALAYLFDGGPALPAPFLNCGADPTPESVCCDVSAAVCP